MFRSLVKTVLLLALMALYNAAIILEPLETRLCKAQFVFKFSVVSASRTVCLQSIKKSSKTSTQAATTLPTTKTPQTSTVSETATNNTPNTTTNTTTTKSATNQTPTKSTQNSTFTFPRRVKRRQCTPLLHQVIVIPTDSVFKGQDKLAKIDAVQSFQIHGMSHLYYYSYVRLDLGFQHDLSLGEYLFVGRQTEGDIADQVFLKNPSTVIPWSKGLEEIINNIDCKTETL